MQSFATLYEKLDSTSSISRKIELMVAYFRTESHREIAWAMHFLTGRRLKRIIAVQKLKEWIIETTTIPLWLFEDCYAVVGDLAETISLLIPNAEKKAFIKCPDSRSLHIVIEEDLLTLKDLPENEQKQRLFSLWSQYDQKQVFLLNKFLTGGFRVGVSKKLVIRALAKAFEKDESFIAHQLMGSWKPDESVVQNLLDPHDQSKVNPAHPYPFCLAYPLDGSIDQLGPIENWTAEWKWDGIRIQMIKRDDLIFLWSRGEEMINEQFPEITDVAPSIPNGCVIDGELLILKDDQPRPFHDLQKRLGRKSPSAKIQQDLPAYVICYDLLEEAGQDLRQQAFQDRRQRLERLMEHGFKSDRLKLSTLINFQDWQELETYWTASRERFAEGLMLKEKSSVYHHGRRKGDWWKWKVEPFTLDMVLLYTQAGHGRRSNLYTDYTLGVWKDGELIPVAKAYSGLTDQELKELDRWIKAHTTEKFGPVRRVEAHQVLEIAFEGIAPSKRHRSGIAVRFPRIVRWRRDKVAAEADTLEHVHKLLSRFYSERGDPGILANK